VAFINYYQKVGVGGRERNKRKGEVRREKGIKINQENPKGT